MTDPAYRLYLCAGPRCTGNGRDATARAVEAAIWDCAADAELRPSGCQARCDFGPNLTVWPGPLRYTHVTPAAAARIVRALCGGPTADDLLVTGLG